MSIHNELNDDEVLRAAGDSLSALPVAGAPDARAIMARGRARRARRLAAAAGLSAAAACTALVLGLTGAIGPAPTRAASTIRTAAFTLVSKVDGTATLTIKPGELLDPATLQSDLQRDGIPAIVTSGSLCTSDPAPAGFSQVVSFSPAGEGTYRPGSGITITIDPSALPAGTELSFGYFQLASGQLSGQQQADMVLVDTSSYTCSSTPPDPNGLPSGYGPDDGFGVLYGGPGPAGS